MLSHLTLFSLQDGASRAIFSSPRFVEAPNWSPDGKYLLVNCERELWRVPLRDPKPQVIPLPKLRGINNDHGISPDGGTLAVSEIHGPVYLCGVNGESPRRITEHDEAYFHGWSPNGQEIAYVAKDGGGCHIFVVSLASGRTRQMTAQRCHDDGPDYSPDGRWIYFNSDRHGGMNIWRIPADGGGAADDAAERITADDYVDWFPHPSPDGQNIVMLSYPPLTQGHPPYKDVVLRLIGESGAVTELARFLGGQGTINVNSWSRDARQFAYVRYAVPIT